MNPQATHTISPPPAVRAHTSGTGAQNDWESMGKAYPDTQIPTRDPRAVCSSKKAFQKHIMQAFFSVYFSCSLSRNLTLKLFKNSVFAQNSGLVKFLFECVLCLGGKKWHNSATCKFKMHCGYRRHLQNEPHFVI